MRMRMRAAGFALAAVAGAAALAAGAFAADRQPVYIGARACAECHDGPAAGNQFSTWMTTKHAHAYAALSLPEATAMARLSGIAGDPEKSPICLGCHATAADNDPWEKDPGFVMQDGVQCEKCHGPGSEYSDPEIMRDPVASRKAGLTYPTKLICQKCHYVKGSHVSVHKKPPLDIEEAWKRIAHPIPAESRGRDWPAPPAPTLAPAPTSGPAYVGFQACEACHTGAAMGYQTSRWRMSQHEHAFAALALPAAAAIARQAGISGDPQAAPACLKCHATGGGAIAGAAGFSYREGVGCEACHGAGSRYMAEAVMRDRTAARAVGLTANPAATCDDCHQTPHGKPFDRAAALAAIAHPTRPKADSGRSGPVARSYDPLGLGLDVHYKNPLNLTIRPGTRELWVACEASGTVVVVDTVTRKVIAEVASGGQPTDVAFSPDGVRAYVSNRLDDSVAVFDAAARRLVKTIPVGDEPHGLLTDRTGKTLFVANALTEDISIVDTATLEEVRRLPASRRPWSIALSPDGVHMLVSNALSRLGPFRTAPVSEATILDVAGRRVENRVILPESNLLLGAAWDPSGQFALVTLNRTKNLVPMTRMSQGWTITNGLGIVWKDGTADQVLLDAPNHYFADATDVAITPDGGRALVTSAGTDRVAVVDIERLTAMLGAASPRERREVIPNHLGLSTDFIEREIAVGASPRGVTVAPDGKFAYVANALDDSVSVIDLLRLEAVARIDLGGPTVVTKLRRGERLFNSANICFQRQLSCHTCHPDGHVDGLTYDIEADGIGLSPVDNRTLRGIYDTDPFKWAGTNASLARQCGPRLAVFFTRIQPFTPEQLSDLNDYTVTITLPPNRHRPLGAPLTEAQRRGKAVFERARTNDGREIPLLGRCVTCHFPPYFSDRSQRDVGTKQALDTSGVIDVPSLNNIYDSAPYLHNGMADTLEEIWTRYNPYDTHGVTNDMTKDQLNDLIEYLKTL